MTCKNKRKTPKLNSIKPIFHQSSCSLDDSNNIKAAEPSTVTITPEQLNSRRPNQADRLARNFQPASRAIMTSQLPRTFWRNHLYIPLAIFVALAISLELSGADALLADTFYRLEGGNWALREAWITSTIIHNVGKHLSLLIALVILIAFISTYFTARLRQYRRELLYLLVAAGGGSLLISVLKDITHVSCAWDFTRYGGSIEYATVFTQILHANGDNCFPAGHASGGYAWLAFYFLGIHLHSKWRWAGLAFALSVGLIFGISQQLRGAHFISHDVWTLGICWFFSLTIFKLMLVGKSAQH